MYCEPNFFDDKKRCRPKPDCKPEYSPLPPFHDKPDMPLPPCGYIFPPVKPYCPGVSPEEQMCILTERVNELIQTINDYSTDVYGAYNAIVNSALCNDAYYNEITTEEGYIAEASAKYKVIHIPFLDRAKQPIYFELGLAYNNTTNANVHEDVFNASQRTIADKLIPAYNSDNTWIGAVVWKGAPIGNIGELPAKYTFGVTDNGFFKVYENLTDYTQLKQDCVRNAFEARSVLIQGGNLTPDKFDPDEKNQQLGRVGVGMNYDTKERFIVIVQGSNQSGCTTEQLANIFKTYNCNIAVELSNGMMTTALDKGAFMFVPPTSDGITVPTIPQVNAFWYITKRRHYHNEYVRDVANLTQKYGEMLWRTETANISVDNVKDVVAGFQRALDTETAERKAADETLQANIDAEAEEREQGDTTLQQNINTLSQHVDEVEQELQQADKVLQQNIDQLRTDLTAKDVKAVVKTSENEKNMYRIQLNDTTFVDVPIETYDYSTLVAKLDTLAALDPRLDAEVQARQEADTRIEAKADKNTSDIAALETEKVAKAGDTMSGNLNMQQNTVTNVKDPVADTDVVTLGYFNANKGDTSGKYLPTAGGTMGGNIDMTGNKIVNVPNPSAGTDVSNKQYVDNQITTQVPTIVSSQIEEKVPQMVADEINKPESPVVTELDKKYLPLTGGALTGALSMGENAITNIAAPSNDTDAANKEYVDNTVQEYVDEAERNITALKPITIEEFYNLNYDKIISDCKKYAGYLMNNQSLIFLSTNSNLDYTIAFSISSIVTNNIDCSVGVLVLELKNATNTVKDSSSKIIGIKSHSAGIGEHENRISMVMGEEIPIIGNVNDPVENSDVSNKHYVDNKVADYLPLTGGTLTGALTLSGDPTENTQAATKGYVDSKIGAAGGGDFMASGAVPMTGNLNMDNHKIVAVSDPTEATDGANKHYVDSAVTSGIAGAQFLPLAGGTMTGDVDLSGHNTRNVFAIGLKKGSTTESILGLTYRANSYYCLEIDKSTTENEPDGPQMIRIGCVGSPRANDEATNKAYVDGKIQELQSALDTANETISTLQSELSTAKNNISTLQGQVSTLNTFMNKFQPMLNTIYNG